MPDWLVGGGGVGTAEAGETRTVATQVLEPGSYAVIDTGAEQPQSAPLVEKIIQVIPPMWSYRTPRARASTASESTPSMFLSGLKSGTNTLLFENAARSCIT